MGFEDIFFEVANLLFGTNGKMIIPLIFLMGRAVAKWGRKEIESSIDKTIDYFSWGFFSFISIYFIARIMKVSFTTNSEAFFIGGLYSITILSNFLLTFSFPRFRISRNIKGKVKYGRPYREDMTPDIFRDEEGKGIIFISIIVFILVLKYLF